MRMSLPQERTHSSRGLYTYSGAVVGGDQGGAMAPPIVETRRKIVNVVGNCRKIVNVVGNCQRCRRGLGGGAEDLKCCRPENFLVCRKKCSVCRKSTSLGPPPKKKNMGPTAPLLT